MRVAVVVSTLALMTVAANANSQTVYEDANGRSAMLLPVGGFVGVNTGEKSIELGWYRQTNDPGFFPGFGIQAAAKDDLASIFQGGDVQPGVSLHGVLGYKLSGQHVVALRYARAWQQAVLATPTEEAIVTKRLRWTWEASAHVSLMFSDQVGTGLAVAREKTNNYGALKKTTLTSIQRYPRPDGSEVEVRTTTDARAGSVLEGHFWAVNADLVLIPFRKLPRVMVRPFGRWVVERDTTVQPRSSIGIDVGLHDGDPVLGRTLAVTFQLNEALPGDEDEKRELPQRIQVGIIADAAKLVTVLAGLLSN